MDSTPIYTELRKTLGDPEDRNWGPSSPPEFAAALAERVERPKAEAKKSARTGPGQRARSRRHRAED
ncbi:hypothetical protein LZ318_24650 [Saccharopolyspora indica]|uniref:hypothetical protein n=1 Tax=Saccharopolyspora indica TaxID=1229659 RepID=UPI0022EA5EDD|nr:hypothetical protein [Saccharopolyspora indica]MDA3650241.1 hypothetical protein [Saccharopolyspora indica]